MANNLNRNNVVLLLSFCCQLNYPSYIGHTHSNMKTRLTQHKQNGAEAKHLSTHHNILNGPLELLTSNVRIIPTVLDTTQLLIYDAPFILNSEADMRRQIVYFVNPIKLFLSHTGQ